MKPLDWLVMFAWLAFIVGYGLYRSRGTTTVDGFLLAGRTMPWYAMGLSIMATQASAVTFISTTGQSYTDGMRFVQLYFGLPLAMVVLCSTAVPIFHRAKVYTAYEYLEQRFDMKTRALVSAIFLIQRGLAAGLSLYAPSLVLSVILGWPDRATTILMGLLVVTYTALGGNKAVTWADVQQMLLISCALVLALFMALHLMPANVSWANAISLAGAAGRLNAVNLHFSWDDRYNLWSGLIGGMFLALAYFGCDQSQVQRYLTGKSIAQSRLSLLFNAMAKIPMQFAILFIGAMVFVLFIFVKPPLLFQPVELKRVQADSRFPAVQQRYDRAFEQRKQAAQDYLDAQRLGNPAGRRRQPQAIRQRANRVQQRSRGGRAIGRERFPRYKFHLSLVRDGLFAGGRGGTDHRSDFYGGDVVDFGRDQFAGGGDGDRFIQKARAQGSFRSSLFERFRKWATLFWGVYAVGFAQYGRSFGALIEAVNIVGSLFYGGMLGVFTLAFFFKKVGPNGAFFGVIAGEAAIFAAFLFTKISFLWYNVVGCLVVIAVGVLVSRVFDGERGAAVRAEA